MSSINVSEYANQLVVGLRCPIILSSQNYLMKIARMSNAQVITMCSIVGEIIESFKKLKETVYEDVTKNYIIELPYTVSSSIIFMKCVNPKDSRGTDLRMIVHLRVEGISDNFVNMVRDSGKIESIKL